MLWKPTQCNCLAVSSLFLRSPVKLQWLLPFFYCFQVLIMGYVSFQTEFWCHMSMVAAIDVKICFVFHRWMMILWGCTWTLQLWLQRMGFAWAPQPLLSLSLNTGRALMDLAKQVGLELLDPVLPSISPFPHHSSPINLTKTAKKIPPSSMAAELGPKWAAP